MKEYAHAMLTLGLLTAALDKAVSDLTTKHTEGLHGLEGIKAVSAKAKALEEQLFQWAEENRGEFGEAKSLEFTHGILSYRLGNRKIGFRSGWDEESVLKKLQSFRVTSQWREYLRTEYSIDRQTLLKQTKDGGKLPEAKLKEIGLKVERDELFSIETKPDAVSKDCDVIP